VTPPTTELFEKSMFVELSVFDPSKVCAVAEFEASNDFVVEFDESKTCDTVEFRFKK
jgi:hypothetical protein